MSVFKNSEKMIRQNKQEYLLKKKAEYRLLVKSTRLSGIDYVYPLENEVVYDV